MLRFATLVFVLLAGQAIAAPGDQMSPSVQAMKAGIICAPLVIGTNPAPDTVAGVTNIVEGDPQFISNGRQVPAVLGIGFGVKAQVAGGADLYDVTVTVSHPPMGNAGITRQTYPTAISGSALSLILYQFDFDYELVQGPWTIEAAQQGNVILHVEFEVVAPQTVPQLATVCGFENLLS